MAYLKNLKKSKFFAFMFGTAFGTMLGTMRNLNAHFPYHLALTFTCFFMPHQKILEIITKSTLKQLKPSITAVTAEISISF